MQTNKKVNTILLIFISLFFTTSSYSQELSKNWFNEDPDENRYAGVSSDLTYSKLLTGKESKTVIVAVIDGGTDINHPDLKDHIWTNEKEIAGNGIDDDQNGYVDDIHGWNFIGGKNGDIDGENLEMVRIYKELKLKFENKPNDHLSKEDKKDFKLYKTLGEKIDKELKNAQAGLKEFGDFKKQLDDMQLNIGKAEITATDVENYKSSDPEFKKTQEEIVLALKSGVPYDAIYGKFYDIYKEYYSLVNYHYNINFTPRTVVGDHADDYSEHSYGNNNVIGPEAEHGTHVAGIIGAVRNNEIGIKGIADNVKIMVVRVVPDGDERDKDVANGIRYAADNGAKVINMSFGKDYSPGRKYVEEAIKYASSKDVLIVHGAGNDHENVDKGSNYPTPYYESTGTRENSWLEVGAISSSGNAANFSNYGKKSVDVFAPGVSIYSTIPDGKYKNLDGTSMAAPTVSGMAVLLRSYFPNLSALQVKKLIVDSVIKVPFKTPKPGSKKKVHFSALCNSQGIVNVYRAVLMAESMP